MRKVIVNEFMSLDGVVQAPGGADEDTSGAFAHGGWHLRFFDELSQTWVLESIVEAGAFLLGRRTYEIFAAYWPNAPEEEQVIAEPLNAKPKYVASTTLSEPLEWQNSTLLQGGVAEASASTSSSPTRATPRYRCSPPRATSPRTRPPHAPSTKPSRSRVGLHRGERLYEDEPASPHPV